ncbi:MAG: hypothetical protein OEY89_15980 [Gammaproteobacteria bacterium]|nr:hypothetical protein [Gammaproteobacteria bacterium]
MAMRLFSKAEFEQHIQKQWGLTPTEIVTKTTKLWKTSDGLYISIPNLKKAETYPDYLLDVVISQIKEIKSQS